MEWAEKYRMIARCGDGIFDGRRKHSAVCKDQIGPR
jgi:hypothetical protein